VGQDGSGIRRLIEASNSALSAISTNNSDDLQRTAALLGPTLQTTRVALANTNDLATVLGPTLRSLRPFVRKLKSVNESGGVLAQTTLGPVKNEIRPFVRNARQPVRNLRPAAKNLVAATPRLTVLAGKLNTLFNMAAYNPKCGVGGCQTTYDNNGADAPLTPNRDEGYLYWLGWLAHVGNSTFQSQDAHGLYRHIYLTVTPCTAKGIIGSSPLAPVLAAITGFGPIASMC
jgi:hypothetical protein